jgi:Flp pilus assembly protein TadG
MFKNITSIFARRQGLLTDQSGAAAIEIAIITPVLVMMALGAVDFVRGFSNQLELQQHAQAGADFVIANGEDIPSDAEVESEIVALSGLEAEDVTVVKWTECNQAKQASYGGCPGNGDVQADYMQITVTHTFEPILDIEGMADFVGTTEMRGTAVVRLPR